MTKKIGDLHLCEECMLFHRTDFPCPIDHETVMLQSSNLNSQVGVFATHKSAEGIIRSDYAKTAQKLHI